MEFGLFIQEMSHSGLPALRSCARATTELDFIFVSVNFNCKSKLISMPEWGYGFFLKIILTQHIHRTSLPQVKQTPLHGCTCRSVATFPHA